MSKSIGWGRYRTETYPQSPAAGGGGGAALVPLSRQRFIDGDTTQLGLNGSIAEPFKTIMGADGFMATRAADAAIATDNSLNNFVGWMMPALGGYVENVAFPPYAATELRADSFSGSTAGGVTITGDVRWDNVAGPQTPAGAGALLHNVSVSGSFTVTDDVDAPISNVVFGGDELSLFDVILGGGFVSSGTTKLQSALFLNAQIGGGIQAGTGVADATVAAFHCVVSGSVQARQLQAVDCFIASAAIACRDGALFQDCEFSPGSTPALGVSNAVANFDGQSWMSFMEAGGTRGAGTAVLVVGGYNGASVEGLALTGAATTVTLDGTGAVTAGYTGENSGNHYTSTNDTPTSVTLETDGALIGDTMLITKGTFGANALAVINGGAGAGTIGTVPTLARGFVLARFNGTNWIFAEGGSLLA